MIARIWRGAVRADDAAAYASYIQETSIENDKKTPGNRGAWALCRADGDQAEFFTVSSWDSRQAIQGFAGQDIETVVFYPEDDRFLVERDLTVRHYEVAGRNERQPRRCGLRVKTAGNTCSWPPLSGEVL